MFDLPDTITIWNQAANNGLGGISWAAPVVANARIANKAEKFTDPSGDDRVSKAVFYARASVLLIGSKVFFGESTSPTPEKAADDVIMISNTPSGAGDLKKGWL